MTTALKFSPGDRVKFIGSEDVPEGWEPPTAGELGIVTHAELQGATGDEYAVYEVLFEGRGHDAPFFDEELELLERAEAPNVLQLACRNGRHISELGARSCMCGELKYDAPLGGAA